jgi:hypothetical protein
VFSLIRIGSGAFRDQLPCEEVDWLDVDADSIEQAGKRNSKSARIEREQRQENFMHTSGPRKHYRCADYHALSVFLSNDEGRV